MEQEYTIDNSYLSPEAQKRKKDLEELQVAVKSAEKFNFPAL